MARRERTVAAQAEPEAESYVFKGKTYTVHPIAAKFPLLEGPVCAAMVESVRADGVRQPILVNGAGRGHHRRRAQPGARGARGGPRATPSRSCRTAWTLSGEIARRNFLRRDQSTSQRAMVAALIRLDARGDWLAVGDGRNDVPSGTAVPSGLDLPAGERPADDTTQARSPRWPAR